MKNHINTLKYIRKDEVFVGLTYNITRNNAKEVQVYMCNIKQVFLLVIDQKTYKKQRDLFNCYLKKFISKIKQYIAITSH